jgi:hypothetical protein
MPLQKVAPVRYASSLFGLYIPSAYDLRKCYYLRGAEGIIFVDEHNVLLHLLLHFTN